MRRHQRYIKYLTSDGDTYEGTVDPRVVSAYLDTQLRLRKSGGAGFTLDPTGKRRKRRRNKKVSRILILYHLSRPKISDDDFTYIQSDKLDGKVAVEAATDSGDGIVEVSGMTAINAKQKRKLKQQENRAKGKTELAKESSVDEAKENGEAESEFKAESPSSTGMEKRKKRHNGLDHGSQAKSTGADAGTLGIKKARFAAPDRAARPMKPAQGKQNSDNGARKKRHQGGEVRAKGPKKV